MAKLVRSELQVGFEEPIGNQTVRASGSATLVLRVQNPDQPLGIRLDNTWTAVEAGDVCEVIATLPNGRRLSKPDHILGRRSIAFRLPAPGYGDLVLSLRHGSDEIAQHVIRLEPPEA
jgi:hypothetical protein